MPQRTVTHPMDNLNINGCHSSLVEDVKEHDYAEIWICISRGHEVHSFSFPKTFWSTVIHFEGKRRLRLCVSICC